MDYLKLIRAHQYSKNLFVFSVLFFSGGLLDINKMVETAIAFLCFCFIASSIYIINDLNDVESDKKHPVKKERPLASEKISKRAAKIISIIMLFLGFSLAVWSSSNLFLILFIYFILNLFYCFYAKNISLIDVFIVATGFVLRVIAGSVVTNIEPSHWLIIMTFLLALFISFAKRRDDIIIEAETGTKLRKSVNGYNLEFINSISTILIAVLIVCYIMYITSTEVIARFNNKPIYFSTVFVLLGLCRYLQISIIEKNSGSPSKLVIEDNFLRFSIALWLLFFVFIIYL